LSKGQSVEKPSRSINLSTSNVYESDTFQASNVSKLASIDLQGSGAALKYDEAIQNSHYNEKKILARQNISMNRVSTALNSGGNICQQAVPVNQAYSKSHYFADLPSPRDWAGLDDELEYNAVFGADTTAFDEVDDLNVPFSIDFLSE